MNYIKKNIPLIRDNALPGKKRWNGVKFLLILFACLAIQINQDTAFAQTRKITLNMENQTLKEALSQIEKQSGFYFTYNVKDLDLNKRVSLQTEQEEITKVLDLLFKGQSLDYTIQGKHIVLSLKGSKKNAQKQHRVSGVVYDKGNEPLIGVSVRVEGTNQGGTTDVDGKYTILVSEPEVKLVFSYIGYQTATLAQQEGTELKVVLKDEAHLIDEVVVTALGIKRSEKALSYNAQVVSSDEVNTVKDANFMNSLTGKVAGVTINSSASGIGGATKVVVRGSKSIDKSNNVLYVIDGLPMLNFSRGELNGDVFADQPTGGEGIGDLNPEDIESMTVLAGPAAAALYGSDAANGAILITTKRGQVGKPKVVVSNQTTFMTPFVTPEFQNRYSNRPGQYASWGDKLDIPSSYDPLNFFNIGTNIQNSIALSFGSEKNQTYLSAASTNADGIIPNNDYNRYNFTARNTSSFLQDKMTLDFGASYIQQDNQNMIAQGVYFNPIVPLYTFPRGERFEEVRLYEEYNNARDINVQRWKWGDQGLNMQNPYWITNRNLFQNQKKRYMLNASLKYDILPWLNVAGRVRVDNANSVEERKLYASTLTLLSGYNGSYGKGIIDERQTYADLMVNINRFFGEEYSLSANIGTSYKDENYELGGFRGNLGKEPNLFFLRGIDKNDAKSRFLEEQWRHQTQSVFANVEFGWRSMLYLTLTGRNDWDSALAGMPEKSFFYPSVGLSGVLTEMLDLPEFINYLKVRGSYASVGSSIPVQLSVPYYTFNEGEGRWSSNTFYPIRQLYPERTESWEAGMNLKFWKNRFDLNLTLYHSNTYRQTIRVPITSASGYDAMYVQTGNIENRGLEASLAFSQKWNDFSWKSSFTASANRNKIVDLGRYTDPDGTLKELDRSTKLTIGSSMIMLETGGTLGDLWTTSIVKKDENGNTYVTDGGQISTEYKLQKVGSIMPKWNFGFSNQFSWKDINLGVVVSARLGGKVISYTQAILDAYGVSEASAIARDQGGIPVNNGFVNAEDWYKTVGGTAGVYSHYVYDATNVRIQELSLGYNLPSRWFKDVVKVSASLVGRNLLMIYNKAPFDPESTASTGNYYQGLDYFMTPSLKSVGFNLKCEF